MTMDEFEMARLKYKPSTIKYLLVAETPPKKDSDRFFYFEKVMTHDSLFLETMKCLYHEHVKNVDTRTLRANKRHFLERFQKDGFYLIDALDEPFEEEYSSSQKIKLLQNGQAKLLKKIKSLCNTGTRVILIAASVFKANYSFLSSNGVNVVNKELLEFPGSGGQKKFKEKLSKLIQNSSK